MDLQEENTPKFKRALGLIDGVMLVVGSMIGSGIFIVSADISRQVGSSGWLVLIWVLSGIITMMAALSYAELSALFPKAGGQYIYLKESYNQLIAFLYGWSFFAVIQTGTIAAVGVAFAKFTAYLIPAWGEQNILFEIGNYHITAAQIVAILVIFLLTYINSLGVKNGKIIQLLFTFTKIVSLIGLIIFGFWASFHTQFWAQNWAQPFHAMHLDVASGQWINIGGTVLFSAILASMVGSLFSSDAWNGVTFIAGEIKNPERNVGLSLFLGTLIVTLIYILANLMYLSVLPLQDIALAPADRVAVAASQSIFGATGTILIAVMIMISTFGCNNGLILAGARVYYTMAQDGLFFKKAAKLNKASVPGWGLWFQCIWASVLCLTGKYGDLLDYVMMVVLIFYILTILGIFILRKRMPNANRPYKAFGYPVIPAVYILLASVICVGLLITRTNTCGWGILIMLIGIPIYYLKKR